MRDLINFIMLMEANTFTSAANLNQNPKRFDALLDMIRTGKDIHFYDKKAAEKDTFVADPSEADRLQELYDSGKFAGSIAIRAIATGEMIPLGTILKTPELGGQATKGGEEGEAGVSKESALLKPSQIGITDYDIPITDLGDEIVSNPTLESTDYGQLVIQMAETLMRGNSPVIPKGTPPKVSKAIVDYACEYLGVLALSVGKSNFPRKEGFEEWLGADVNSLIVNFPGKSNEPLADSYAMVKNTKTNHTVNISSKGTGGGAPPALGGLKISNDIRNNTDYEASVKLIEICQNLGTIPQIFAAMNLLYEYAPDSIPKQFNDFLPWDVDKMTALVKDNIKSFKQKKPQALPEFHKLWDSSKFGNTPDGGRLAYVTKFAVMKAVNEGAALPEFQDVVLQILDMNFVQQYASLEAKTREVKFATQWPAKLEGKVALMSKAGSDDPTKGSFSFKLSNTNPKTVLPMPGSEPESGSDGDPDDFAKKAAMIAGRRASSDAPAAGKGGPGREKRK